MPRFVYHVALAAGLMLAVVHPVHAQATYHFHNEASSTTGLKQLKRAGPDVARVSILSADMKSLPAGPGTIVTFYTHAGVPRHGGVIPASRSVTFTLWMKKSASFGTVFPHVSLGLNVPVSATLCEATGTSALTTTLTAYTLSCNVPSAIVIETTDRLAVTAGFDMTVGPGAKSMKVALDIEGTLNGSADSRVVVPKPVPPSLTGLTPKSGGVGTPITVAGANFGATQGTSTLTFNGVTASPTSWSSGSIAASVPAGATSGPVVVTVGGAASNRRPFTVAQPPSITSLTPSTGAVGVVIAVAGANFGATQGASTVTFPGAAAAPTGWTDTSIAVPVPAGATTGPVVVTVAGQASNGVTFIVDRGTGTGLLEITSPTEGTVVAPGQTVTVTVSSPDNSTFLDVTVVAGGHMAIPDPATTLPAQFSITIPVDADFRPYPLTAFGVTTSGSESFSTITIDVERSDLPVEIAPAVREIIFQAEGERDAIDLAARFDDGAEHAVRRSSRVAYESSDPTVATVDSAGIVTAVAEGEADVTATYGPPDAGISATIPVSVPPSILAVTPPTIDFGTQAVGSSATQQMTITNNSSGDLTIPDVATSGDFSQSNNCMASSPLAPGGSCTISITFGPTAAGPRPGAVNIKSSFHVVPVAIMLTGTGVS